MFSTKDSVLINLDRAVIVSGKRQRESSLDRLCPLVVEVTGQPYRDGTGGYWKPMYQVITKAWNSYVLYESFSRKRAEKKMARLNASFGCPVEASIARYMLASGRGVVMRNRLWSASVCFLLLASCIFVEKSAVVRATIQRHNSDMERWYASGDVDAAAGMFAEDAWQMPPNNPPLVGRDAIRAFWKQAFGWGKWQFSFRTEDVRTSGRLAVERGKYVLSFTAAAGAPPGMTSFTDHGNYVTYWREEPDGEWRAVWDAPVSEVPANQK
jgi:ketosteroid isomerase-like protein